MMHVERITGSQTKFKISILELSLFDYILVKGIISIKP